MAQYFKFDAGEQAVEVEVSRLRLNFYQTLKSHIGQVSADVGRNRLSTDINYGLVENLVLAQCLESLKVNGRAYPVDPNDPLRNLPDIADEGYEDSVVEEILRRVVKVNGKLHRNEPYLRVFGVYRPEDEEEEDPTQTADTSESSADSSSPSPQSPTPLPKHDATESADSQAS
jgi:hypothetical protein